MLTNYCFLKGYVAYFISQATRNIWNYLKTYPKQVESNIISTEENPLNERRLLECEEISQQNKVLTQGENSLSGRKLSF